MHVPTQMLSEAAARQTRAARRAIKRAAERQLKRAALGRLPAPPRTPRLEGAERERVYFLPARVPCAEPFDGERETVRVAS